MYKFYIKSKVQLPGYARKYLLVMKLAIFMLITTILHVSANTFAQKITLTEKHAPLKKVFDDISNQSGYDFLFSSETLKEAKPVSIHIQNQELSNVLHQIFSTQPLSYVIQEKMIVVSRKIKLVSAQLHITVIPLTISGKVVDTAGEPLSNAIIKVNDKVVSYAANDGSFSIKARAGDIITISFLGYSYFRFKVKISLNNQIIQLHRGSNELDEVQIIGYGTTTRRLTTGDEASVKAAEIEKQPVSNPLLALEGQVPGLNIIQSSGVPGAGVTVQLRGQNSILQGSDPLYIIDGVPFSPGNAPLNQISSAAGSGLSTSDGMSPMNLINPSDIESIDVLKDADATAIYGSRGANGVILITTKKGKAGKTIVSAKIYSGASTVTRTVNMLNTQQYVAMREEAFKNDGLIPDASGAPDLFLWDTTRYTNFKKLLIGNTAHTDDGQLSVSGGNANTQFLISGGYHHETTVFPTTNGDSRASAHVSINHTSDNKKLTLSFNTIYASDVNKLPATDLTGYINTPPNLKLYAAPGQLNWEEGEASYYSLGLLNENPLSFEYQAYTGKFENLNSNLQVNYKVATGLAFNVNLGYNLVYSDETSLYPSTSIDPYSGQLPYSYFADQTQLSWIIEPQLEYKRAIGRGRLDVLIGNTWQNNSSSGIGVSASDYSSDLLLSSIAAAGNTQTTNNYNQYRYDGLYGRLNYVWSDKYIVTASGRRDGSSRFGPNNRFSDFGALGAAWIFSEEKLIKNALPFLSYGKLRGSYGVNGNDQIGNYRYLDTWSAGSATYQGLSVLNPSSLYNPNFTWEKNIKAEIAIDLGFFRNKLMVTADFYDDRSNNQLINYTLPSQTGFTSVLENLNALVRNTGWELQLNSKNINSTHFSWTSDFNITIPENKLLAFPGLATSSYANTYVIGQSISTRRYYDFTGVNPATGVYRFRGEDQNGNLTVANKTILKNTDPDFYGGLTNSFRYNSVTLSFFLEYRKQNGYNYLNTLGTGAGFGYVNQPVYVLGRWQKPGDITNIEKFTASDSPALDASALYLTSSNAVISDASFIRLKNLSLAYQLKAEWINKIHITSCRVYVQGENLLTITRYLGSDPENQNIYILPPLKTLTAGIQFTL